MQVFYGHVCLSEVICIYKCLWYSLKNTTMKFHTFDVVVGNRGAFCTYGAGRALCLSLWASLFIYFIFICITASLRRSVILWILFIFSLNVVRFCTTGIECNSHTDQRVELLDVNICEMLSIYLLISWVACNLTYSVPSLLDLYQVDWNEWIATKLCFFPF